MNISGIGVIRAQLLKQQQSSQKSLEEILLDKNLSASSPFEKESLHMEIELRDGTKISIDYEYEGMSKKTAYELGKYTDYTYGNDLFSPESTSGRILDFARSLWDGSEEKLETLAKAIDEGIKGAKDILGNMPGWLSGIVGRTEDLVHKGIEEMKAEIMNAA